MQKRLLTYILPLMLVIFLASCSGFNKVLKSKDPEKKYEAALKYYEKKDYYKAGILFDDLLVSFKGDKRFEEVYYYYAYCKYANGEMIMASYHFKNFFESFPNSKKAEEALYMHVYCDYLESYPYYLDPSVTRLAMDNLQLFINIYPNSEHVADCNKYIDDLRGRLRKKSLESAKLYYRMQDYQAAIIAFNNTIKDYPELENMDEVEALLVRCQYLLAYHSVESKKIERYKEIEGMVSQFEASYGKDNKYYREVASFWKKAQSAISRLALDKGLNLMERSQFAQAATVFREQLQTGDYSKKDELHYLLVKALYKAGKKSKSKEVFTECVREAEAFLAEYSGSAYAKKVKRYLSKAKNRQ